MILTEKHRYYFRLKKSIGELCRENDKDLPSEKALSKIARMRGFAFNEKNVQPALYENGPFADGLLQALSIWLGIHENEIAGFTLDSPLHKEARIGDFFLMGMRPLVERLTGSHRLKEEAFFKSERDIDRAYEINLCEIGAFHWADTDRQPTKEDLIRTALDKANLPSLEDYKSMLTGLWRFNPLTVIYAVTSSRNKVGVSCVLPLKKDVYDEIRTGQKSAFKVGACDMEWPSNHQLIHIAAVRTDEKNGTPKAEQTRCLASSIFIQIAMMAAEPLHDLRVLSYGGTPNNHKRLEQSGFANLGVNEPQMNVSLFEIKQGQPSFTWATKLLNSIQAANR